MEPDHRVAQHVAALVIMPSRPCAEPAKGRWAKVLVEGEVPDPRFGHVCVSMHVSPTQAALDAARRIRPVIPSIPYSGPHPTRLGYFVPLPLGYGGPYLDPKRRRDVVDGVVYDPPPEIEADLLFHAACKRLLMFGGIAFSGNFHVVDKVYHLCIPPRIRTGTAAAASSAATLAASDSLPVLSPSKVSPSRRKSPSHATAAATATGAPHIATQLKQGLGSLTSVMSPIKIPRSVAVSAQCRLTACSADPDSLCNHILLWILQILKECEDAINGSPGMCVSLAFESNMCCS